MAVSRQAMGSDQMPVQRWSSRLSSRADVRPRGLTGLCSPRAVGVPHTRSSALAATPASPVPAAASRPRAAIETSEAAWARARDHGAPGLLTRAGTALASTLARAGRTTDALDLAESLATELLDAVDDTHRGMIWGHLAALRSYHVGTDPQMAARARYAARSALATAGLADAQRGDMELYLARLCETPAQRAEHLAAATSWFEQAGSLMGLGMAHHDRAGIAYQRQDWPEALHQFRASAWALDRAGHGAVANARLGVGTTLLASGAHDAAEPILRQVRRQGRSARHAALDFAATVALCSVAIRREAWRDAEELLDHAEGIDLGRKLQPVELEPLFVDSEARANQAGQRALAARLGALADTVQQ